MAAPNKRYDFVKAFLDRLSAGILLVLAGPVMMVVAIFVAATLGRPIVFAQQRLGLRGRVFTIYKFRTMLEGGGDSGLADDANRHTSAGTLLRSLSLDELPQLWNVVKGDMSFIGPRPLLVEYLSLYAPAQARRMEVKPGITGLSQVLGGNSLSWEERFRLDLEYVDSYGLRRDIVILLKTGVVLTKAALRLRKGSHSSQPFTGRAGSGSQRS
jgi:lipopolysaccharide/colanic/teichoic acid biosynthesis glycosyltransferase